MKRRFGIAYALVLFAGPTSVVAAPNPIEIQEPGTNLFAEKKVEYVVALHVPGSFKGRLDWAFSAANGQVFPRGRGEQAVAGKGAGPAVVKLTIETPPVKPGAVLEARLELSLYGNAQKTPEAELKRKIYIFPPDPFVARMDWLKDLKLVVFDPNDKSKTVEALEALKVPHERIKQVDKLADQKEGIVIVGEGVSFKDERGLAEALVQLAQRGCKVICLAVEDGSFALPGIGSDAISQAGLTFRRNGVIRQLEQAPRPRALGFQRLVIRAFAAPRIG